MKFRLSSFHSSALLLSGWFFAAPVRGEIQSVTSIVLSVADLDRELAFYTNVLSFQVVQEARSTSPVEASLANLPSAQTRSATLQLGEERLELLQFVAPSGRPFPTDSRSFDHWFQHVALVVTDTERAYNHLRKHRVKSVSTAPQRLPDWNPNAGGIQAFYFRDPEEHVLEIIQFPPGKGDPRWQSFPKGSLFLGIDHTAIVVSDTEQSLRFYRERLGLRVVGHSENWGVEQEHLNQVFGARLQITALRAPRGPGIEFLEYLTPPGGRPLPPGAQVPDLLGWRVVLESSNPAPIANGSVIGRTSNRSLLRDPDGHLLELRAADGASH